MRSNPRLSQEDARAFVNLVMATLSQEEFHEFLNIMRDFKARTIDAFGVKNRVKKIFAEHWNLYFGFDIFLPSGYKFIGPDVRESAELLIGIQFEKKLQIRFKDKIDVYNSFRDLVNLCKESNSDMKSAGEKILKLFQGHDDLLTEFICFTPYILKTCLMDRKDSLEYDFSNLRIN